MTDVEVSSVGSVPSECCDFLDLLSIEDDSSSLLGGEVCLGTEALFLPNRRLPSRHPSFSALDEELRENMVFIGARHIITCEGEESVLLLLQSDTSSEKEGRSEEARIRRFD